MKGHSRWPSWPAVAVGVLIALLSVVGCVLILRVANEQEHDLLVGQTRQAAQVMAERLASLYAPVNAAASEAELVAHFPKEFHYFSFRITSTVQHPSMVLLRRAGNSYVVYGALGSVFHIGQTISGPIAATISSADKGQTPTPTAVVRVGNGSTFGFALGPPATPAGIAVYEQLSIPVVFRPEGNLPFTSINFALYGSRTPEPAHLVLANTSALPLQGPTVETPVQVGTTTWLAVGSAKGPLTGSLDRATGWIILVAGLLMAVMVAVTLDVVMRRRRYAEVQVAMRTAELAQSMSDLKEAQATLVQRERLAAIGQMASVVGHELRNPLTAVTNALYLIRATGGSAMSPAVEPHLEMAEREVGRAATLAQDLTDFVRPRTPVPEPFGLDQLLEEVMQAAPPPAGITVRAHVGRLIVVADRVQIGELVTNLITNAYQAIGSSGRVWVWAEPVDGQVKVSVQDDGPGIPPESAVNIFEPFVTTKARGTGLGLAIVRRIVEEHGGWVAVEPHDEPGARIVATLPGVPEQNGPAHRRSDEPTGIWVGGDEEHAMGNVATPS